MNIYFIRHGFSCTNIHYLNPNTNVLGKEYYDDPLLSNTGVKDSKSMAKFTKTMDYTVVACSPLNRAIETALHMFPNNYIFIIPYVKEIRDTPDCTSVNLEVKKKLFKKLYPKHYNRLIFDYINDENINTSSYLEFKKFVNENFKGHTMCVITHSLYMIKHLKIPKNPFPNNNCIYKIHFKNYIKTLIHKGTIQDRNTINVSRCIKKQSIVLFK